MLKSKNCRNLTLVRYGQVWGDLKKYPLWFSLVVSCVWGALLFGWKCSRFFVRAGVLRGRDGKVTHILNDINHFRPTRLEAVSSLRFLAYLDILHPALKIDKVPTTSHGVNGLYSFRSRLFAQWIGGVDLLKNKLLIAIYNKLMASSHLMVSKLKKYFCRDI